MNLKNQYRLRVKNCIGTIIDVHNSILPEHENREFLAQFYSLEDAVETLDMSVVSEGDVLNVERATNELLREFREVFQAGDFGGVYEPLDS
jgi:hypothetical protein